MRAWSNLALRNLMTRSAAAPYLGSPVSLLRWMNSICMHMEHFSCLCHMKFALLLSSVVLSNQTNV